MSQPIIFTVYYRDGTIEETPFGLRHWGEIHHGEIEELFKGYLENIWKLGLNKQFLHLFPKFFEISKIEYHGHLYELDMEGIKTVLESKKHEHKWEDVMPTQGEVITGRRCSLCQKQEWY